MQGGVVEAFLQASGLSLTAVEFCCATEGAEASSSGSTQQRYGVALLSNNSSKPSPTHAAALAAVSKRLLPGAVLYVHEKVAGCCKNLLYFSTPVEAS